MLKEFEEIEFLNNCIICGNSHPVNYEKATWLLNLKEPFRVVRCPICRLSWLNPRPTKNAYKKIYSMNIYFRNYRTTVSNRMDHFLYRVKRLKNIFPLKELKLLDIGSATGEFVALCRDSGIDGIGLELSDYAIKKAIKNYGDHFFKGDVKSFSDKEWSFCFDVVHLNHTFEHFLNPADSLIEIRKLLKQDGILVIEVPYQFNNIVENFKFLLGRATPKEFGLFSLHHPFFYSPYSLLQLLSKCGFDIISLRTYLPTEIVGSQILGGQKIKRILLKVGDMFFKKGDVIEVFATKQD